MLSASGLSTDLAFAILQLQFLRIISGLSISLLLIRIQLLLWKRNYRRFQMQLEMSQRQRQEGTYQRLLLLLAITK